MTSITTETGLPASTPDPTDLTTMRADTRDDDPDGAHAHLSLDGEVTLAYRAPERSSGPSLVLLHGLSGASSSWAPVTDRVGGNWRTWALDFRGHGRSDHTPGGYRLDDYRADAVGLLETIGEPAVVVGHSLGSIVAATLAQEHHPLVAGVFLEDPPLYLVEPAVFAGTGLARVFRLLTDHVERLQAERAPIAAYRKLLAAAPHPAGDTQGDHMLPDALWSRAEALAQMDTDAITATLDGRTFIGYQADRPIACPGVVVRADPAYDAGFLPSHQARLHATSPHIDVVDMPGSGHNIRGDRAARTRYLDVLDDFLSGLT